MKTALFLSIISFSLWSAEMEKQAWHHRDDHYLFSYDEKSGAIISLNCMNDELSLEKSTCEAAKIFREKKPVKLPRGALQGGKNPGAVICSLGLKKKILILKDTKNNENSFCQFGDGSMISASNLQTLIKE